MYTADMVNPVYMILPSISSNYTLHIPQISPVRKDNEKKDNSCKSPSSYDLQSSLALSLDSLTICGNKYGTVEPRMTS